MGRRHPRTARRRPRSERCPGDDPNGQETDLQRGIEVLARGASERRAPHRFLRLSGTCQTSDKFILQIGPGPRSQVRHRREVRRPPRRVSTGDRKFDPRNRPERTSVNETGGSVSVLAAKSRRRRGSSTHVGMISVHLGLPSAPRVERSASSDARGRERSFAVPDSIASCRPAGDARARVHAPLPGVRAYADLMRNTIPTDRRLGGPVLGRRCRRSGTGTPGWGKTTKRGFHTTITGTTRRGSEVDIQ
jgi:hypothetical protein